jgi:predicted SnoaL-like aldol condensation-catalyzing enzyme
MKSSTRPHLVLLFLILSPFTLAQGDSAAEVNNRDIVMAYYQAVYNDKDARVAIDLLAPVFIQHHPDIADGASGLASMINSTRLETPQSARQFKRILTDGDYVIVQAHATNGPDDPGAVTGDIFRLNNGHIAEQWGIVHPITPSPDPDNPNDVFGSNSAPYPAPTSTAQERQNIAMAIGFYNAALNEKNWEKTATYMGDYYQQHSIYMEDGKTGFRELVERIKREFPNNLGKFKQSFADGDMVVLNLEVTRDKGGLTYNVIELMRLENNKVVEHWDIFERVGETSENDNGLW